MTCSRAVRASDTCLLVQLVIFNETGFVTTDTLGAGDVGYAPKVRLECSDWVSLQTEIAFMASGHLVSSCCLTSMASRSSGKLCLAHAAFGGI